MNKQLVIDFLNTLSTAMVARDIETLDAIMEDDAVLQHITGYLQPKDEWLAQVAVDYFTYREISIDNVDVEFGNNMCYVEYDSTIVGNSRWPFRNRVTLKFDGESLKWTGCNQLWFR